MCLLCYTEVMDTNRCGLGLAGLLRQQIDLHWSRVLVSAHQRTGSVTLKESLMVTAAKSATIVAPK